MVVISEEGFGLAGVVGLVPFPIWPTHFGGAERCWNVLSRFAPITVHGLSWEGRSESWTRDGVNYRIHSAPPEAWEHAERLQAWGFRTFDATPSMSSKYLRAFAETVKAEEPDLVVVEHPWLVEFVPDGVPFVYDSHNSEAHHYAARWGAVGPEFENVKALEKYAVQESEIVTACSLADLEILREMFGEFESMHVPNGVSLPDLQGRTRNPMLLFIGSQYGPNVEAAQRLVSLAAFLPEFQIVIAGGCSLHVKSDAPNVALLGPVSDDQLHDLFLNAGLFVNLMTSGSGTHLKIGRALSYGVPVVTTEVGKRGYETPLQAPISNPVDFIRTAWSDYDRLSSEGLREASGLAWDVVMDPLKNWVDARR